jgi:hypothetical protein
VNDPQTWLDALIASLSEKGSPDDRWRDSVNSYPELVIEILESSPSLPVLTTLAELAEPTSSLIAKGFNPWRPLVETNEIEDMKNGLALLMTLQLAQKSVEPTALGSVYAFLYRRLRTETMRWGWSMISPELPGDANDWDRCHRLADGVARKIRNTDRNTRDTTVDVAWRSDMAAGTALRESLESNSKRRGWLGILPEDWF